MLKITSHFLYVTETLVLLAAVACHVVAYIYPELELDLHAISISLVIIYLCAGMLHNRLLIWRQEKIVNQLKVLVDE